MGPITQHCEETSCLLWSGEDPVLVDVSMFRLQELRGEPAAQDADALGRRGRGARVAAGGGQQQTLNTSSRSTAEPHNFHHGRPTVRFIMSAGNAVIHPSFCPIPLFQLRCILGLWFLFFSRYTTSVHSTLEALQLCAI